MWYVVRSVPVSARFPGLQYHRPEPGGSHVERDAANRHAARLRRDLDALRELVYVVADSELPTFPPDCDREGWFTDGEGRRFALGAGELVAID